MRGALSAALLLLATATEAADSATTFHVGDPAQWGRVIDMPAQPYYPKPALDKGRGGYVEIQGRVTPQGTLDQVKYAPDTPASAAFIAPLQQVISQWRFEAPLGRDCQPSQERVTNRVYFSVANGKGGVRVTVVPPEDARRSIPRLAPVKREEPRLESLQPKAPHPAIYTRMQVAPAGDVISVEPRSYSRQAGVRELEQEVIRALTQWKFPPAPDTGVNRFVCYAVRR